MQQKMQKMQTELQFILALTVSGVLALAFAAEVLELGLTVELRNEAAREDLPHNLRMGGSAQLLVPQRYTPPSLQQRLATAGPSPNPAAANDSVVHLRISRNAAPSITAKQS